MIKRLFFLMILPCLFEILNPLPVYALKIESEKIKEVVSKIMGEKEDRKSNAGQEEALKEYEIFLNQFEINTNQQAEALVRLGHLIMAMEEEEEIRKNPKLLFYPKVHAFSIGIYEKIRSNFLLYSGNDEVLYHLAHGYYEENQKDKSLSILQELAARFPKSAYTSEAMFRIGEIYFEEGKYPEASEAYLKALEPNPPRPLMEIISYKMTWSVFKMGDYQKTVDMVTTALNRYSFHRKDGTTVLDIESLTEANWKQVKELLHLAILSIDFWGGVTKARSYFDFHGHVSYENLIYRPLGHLYLNRGKFQEAAQTFNTFLSLYPTHEDAPQFQMDLIETYQKAEKWELAKQARASLLENYRPGSAWWKDNSPAAQDKINLLRKEILFQQAQTYHGEAQKSKKREDYLMAITAYQNFLSDFSRGLEAPRIQYFLGEAYFETGQFEQAASAYEISAYQYPLHLYSQEAAFAALIAYEKAILKSNAPPDTLRLALLKSCQSFIKAFPESSKKQSVLFKALSLAFQTGNAREGRVYARQILEAPLENLPVKMIVQAHYWLGKSYFEERDYNRAETEFKETLAWSKRSDYHDPEGPFPGELKTFLSSIQYKRAEALKNGLKWKEAATAFFHIYEEFPESEITPVSLMNAGSAFLEVKDYDSALKSFNTVVNQYPQSPYFTEAQSALPTIYEKENKWNEAAAEYELLIKRSNDPDKINRYSDKLYSLFFKAENWKTIFQLLGPSFKNRTLHNLKWLYFYAASARHLNMEAETLSAAETSLALLNKKPDHDPEEEEWVMKSVLLKGDILFNQFGSLFLSNPLETSLPLKKEKLKETMDTFTLAAQSNYPDIVSEALYHIGNLFEQFANDLGRSERPKDLTPEQSEIYEGLLRNQIDPLYRKALEVYQKNLTLSNQVDNAWIKKSEERVNRLLTEKKGA